MAGNRPGRCLVLICALTLFSGAAAAAAENPVKIRASVAGGFDDNTGLNSERKGDYFAQENVSLLYRRLLDSKSQARLSYNVLNVNYFEATDLNILLNEVGGGFSRLLTPTTVWENDYTFQYLDFTRNESVTSYEHEVRSGIRQRINDRWMLKSGFTYSFREYTERTMRSGSGILSADEERTDDRYTLDAQLTFKWRPDVMFNTGGLIYRADSNDQFHDYYDYDAWRVHAGWSWQISERWLALTRLTYERRDYGSRPLLDEGTLTQEDDLYTANLAVYYKLHQNLSAGAVYTYREKDSNEPSQQYSGTLGTLGLYGSF